MKIALLRPLDAGTLGTLLPFCIPAGADLVPKRSYWLIRRGSRQLRVRLAKDGMRVDLTMQTPGWAYAFLVLGLIPFVIAVFVFDAAVKDFAEEVRVRLQAALASPPPARPPAPCPFCRQIVQPLVDAQGKLLCPACRNTGRAPALAVPA